ncbi:tRNA pseudouridine(55) synthase TruB [Candidatus Binatia bacterium]|jgi:tRNA pseudouridine55 synthase|nr:tRNA pseudouridine(55) synthase TruB [Candidatus Binatia bacterium]
MPDGVLLVDKPGGETSAGIIRILKRTLHPRKIGHLGTLDPMATGVLPLCLDGGTRIAQFLDAADKGYSGEILLGLATDTADITGQETARGEVPALSSELLESVASKFLGHREQIPPMYSAVKIKGKQLYKMARAGIEVERQPRPIRIDQFSLELTSELDRIRFAVECSKGTYVRVLAEEVGAALGCPATLASLRRTRFGPFGVSECHELHAIQGCASEKIPVLSCLEALRGVPQVTVDGPRAYQVAVGGKGCLSGLSLPAGASRVALVEPAGELLAIVDCDPGGSWQLRRVLYPDAVDLYRPTARC